MDLRFVVPMALAAASKAFRASTFCPDAVLAPTVIRATKKTARSQNFRVICLSSLGVEIYSHVQPNLLARLYVATGLFSKRIYRGTAACESHDRNHCPKRGTRDARGTASRMRVLGAAEGQQGDFRRNAEADGSADGAEAAVHVDQRC